MKNHNLSESFKHALQGIRHTLARERNFKIHIAMGILAVVLCIVLRVETYLFMWVMFSIFFVLCMELLNSSVEALTDLICNNQKHPLAKIAKDTAAAAVLLASALAVLVAIVVAVSLITKWMSG